MAGTIDNKNAAYSEKEMESLISAYIKHLSKGYSKESFVDCDYRTIENYLENETIVLQSTKRDLEKAYRKGRMFWETIGTMGTMGMDRFKDVNGEIQTLKSFNATSWIFNMKNRYCQEWRDRKDLTVEGIPKDFSINVTNPEIAKELKDYLDGPKSD